MGEYRNDKRQSCSWRVMPVSGLRNHLLCPFCLLQGYCRDLTAHLVSDIELDNPHLICDVRAQIAKLGIKPDSAHEWVVNLYRDYRGRILDANGQEIFLQTELLENASREFWRTLCRPCSPDCRPRMRSAETREWYRIIATILKANYPVETMMWGVRAANDNRKPQ